MSKPNHSAPVRAYGGVSAAERTSERRRKLLDAGLELIGTAGYRATTVRGLCRLAGLNDRYFYALFEDMEALLCAVYQTQLEALTHELLAAIPHFPQGLSLRLKAGLQLFFNQMRDERIARVTLTEVLGVSPKVDAIYNTNTRQFSALLVGLLKTELPALKLAPDVESSVCIGLVGVCVMLATQWMLDGYRTPQAAVIESCALIFLGTLRELEATATPA